MSVAELLKSLRSLVAYHQSCGVDNYRSSKALTSGLQILDGLAVGQPGSDKAVSTSPTIKAVPETENIRTGILTIDDLAVEIRGCRICPLHKAKKANTAGKGGLQPGLVVVGDWLVHGTDPYQDEIFGVQQDLMLSRMVAAIDLKPAEVFITNTIKCSVTELYKSDSSHIAACLSYLKQQIALLSPKVICTMGIVASQTLLNSSQSLIKLRGRFHEFHSGSGKTIPVLPTFHPSYLLKNPEMKQPTWNDLQAVKRKLDQAL